VEGCADESRKEWMNMWVDEWRKESMNRLKDMWMNGGKSGWICGRIGG
jgi:hypothetical protein